MFNKIEELVFVDNVKAIVKKYNERLSLDDKKSASIIEVLPFTFDNVKQMKENDLILSGVDLQMDESISICKVTQISLKSTYSHIYQLDANSTHSISNITIKGSGNTIVEMFEDTDNGFMAALAGNFDGPMKIYADNNIGIFHNQLILKVAEGGTPLLSTNLVDEASKAFMNQEVAV